MRGRYVDRRNVARCVLIGTSPKRRRERGVWRLCVSTIEPVMKAVFSAEYFLMKRLGVCVCGRYCRTNLFNHVVACPVFVSMVRAIEGIVSMLYDARTKFKCPYCGWSTSSGSLLANHIIWDHKIALRKDFAIKGLSTWWMNYRDPLVLIHRDVARAIPELVDEYRIVAGSYGARVETFSERRLPRRGTVVEVWVPIGVSGLDPEGVKRYVSIPLERFSAPSRES